MIPGRKGEPILRTKMKTKTGRRSIDVPAELMARLRRHKLWQAEHAMRWGGEYHRDLQFVFPTRNGKPPAPDNLTHALRRLMKAAGIARAQPAHGWRHSMPIRLLEDGHDVVTVSRRMGHAKPSMTLDRYGHSTRRRIARRPRPWAKSWPKSVRSNREREWLLAELWQDFSEMVSRVGIS